MATTPYLPHLTAYFTLSPREGGTFDFFKNQSDRKGRTLDYLDGLGHFFFVVGR